MASPRAKDSYNNDEESQNDQQQQQEPLIPPPRAARTYYIPITSATTEIRQDWLERMNMFFTLGGAAFVLLGACAIVLPLFLSITVTTLTSWILVASGIVGVIHFLLVFGAPSTTGLILLAALDLGVGIWFLISSSAVEDTMFIYITVGWFILQGAILILMTCQLRTLTSWPALLVAGVISILLGAANFVFTSDFGFTFFSLLFGANLALTGFAFFLISFMACLASRASSTQEPLLEEAASHRASEAQAQAP